MELETVLDELYALRPQEFTAARNAAAAAARQAGDRELAEGIRALRRPTVSAWACNLLVRREPEKIQPLISLGEGLRAAHRDLDGEQLRELGRQQHLLVGALAKEARQLAADAGQAVGDNALHEVEATLHAVLADPQAAREWAAGHLEKPLSAPVGFSGLEASAGAVATPARPRAKTPAPAAEPDEDRRDRRHREKLDRARQEAEAAERRARESEQAREAAAAELEQAQAASEESGERVAALERELTQARKQRRRTEDGMREARDRAAAADRTARDARNHAKKTAAAAERLSVHGA
ncbi:hypothetical protein ABZ070_20580 [Streptomyces sp. NPDC006283]|uniref:hypothetical protein n=1 Tax=Streptomyces sp. NPDC006283 TaxID=3156741 RepID=UPI0033BB9CD5